MKKDSRGEEILGILRCPECKTGFDKNTGICLSCRKPPPSCNGKYCFVTRESGLSADSTDWLNRIKFVIKARFPGVYPKLITLLSPVYGSDPTRSFLDEFSDSAIVVNLGSGTSNFKRSNVINADIENFKNVDVVLDLSDIPFLDDSVDGILNIAVLEHVPYPDQIIKEFFRIMKPRARALIFIPFMQGFHASPNDFQRYTSSGIRTLFKEFEIKSLVPEGPTSALIWILQEWLAMTFSLGSVSLYKIFLVVSWVLSPLKYIDVMLRKHPCAENIASGFYVEVQKPA